MVLIQPKCADSGAFDESDAQFMPHRSKRGKVLKRTSFWWDTKDGLPALMTGHPSAKATTAGCMAEPAAARALQRAPEHDLWPDTSAYDPSELYPVEGLTLRDGSPAKVFSSRDPRTVRRHFHWMAEHAVDGAFLQRFVGQVDPEEAGNRDARYGGTRRLRDDVGRRVREAAEAEGRVWAIMYDVSGVAAADLLRIVAQDFAHLVHDERIFDSPAYLRERGRPVVGVWGLGLADSPVPPDTARAVYAALRALADVYIFAGVPSHWRSRARRRARGPRGAVDALSPWSVGRFGTGAEVEAWAAERWAGDAERVAKHNQAIELGGARGRRVDYVPVVLPGGSGFNLSEGKWAFNGIKRNGGKFLWTQIFHAKRLKGVRSMYGAMWDEYDEGTAFLPAVEKKRLLPESENWPFLALDEDGYDLPADWYMRIAGFAAEGLRSERRIHDSFPSKELQDYWGARPRYEDAAAPSSSSSGSAPYAASAAVSAAGPGAGAGAKEETPAEREAKAQFDIWAEEQRAKEAAAEDVPPPAYSLEDEGPAGQEGPIAAAPVQQQHAPVQQQHAPTPHAHAQPPLQNGTPPPQQQFGPPLHNQPQGSYAPQPVTDAAVGALAGDFARQRLASPPPQHPARRESGGRAGVGAGVERPPVHPALRVASPPHGAYQPAQHTGGSGSSAQRSRSSSRIRAGAAHGGSGVSSAGRRATRAAAAAYPVQQQPQHMGGSAPQGAYQQPQHTGGSAQYPAQGAYQQQQQQHTGGSGSGSYPAPHQQHAQSPEPHRLQQQQTGGSGSYPAPGARPTSTYPGQAAGGYAPPPGPSLGHSVSLSARPTSSYSAPEGAGYASGSGLGHSASLSARPPSTMYPGASPQGPSVRPDSAPRPTTPGYASYPAGGGNAYPASPPPHGGPPLGPHASLAPRPDSARPTTPGYGQAGPPMGPPQHSAYSNQFPSSTPPPASYPGSSYNPPSSLPSPDIPGPSFPSGPQYGAPYQPPPHVPQPSGYPGQSFPSPQPGPYSGSPSPPGGPHYPPAGPSFPHGGPDNAYFYQQPPQPQFPGYSPPQPDMYNNYAQQPQGPWGRPPPMPHRPGSLPQAGYGQPVSYGFPTAQTGPPSSGPLGFATTSVDKLVGRRTREQLEGTVESLTQSSTKLLNKFRL
ncbi:hypothetical protein B0H17DRAFT_1219148 [Mycena rosella]|uniref:Uncharacterized protein n=1 Tax=Mycena rosella TaxID=1033263 RepID=A0AAD7BJH3_MYCRO|nr:hypothetical protein B0H17DRAFT_1219148 [Mycena rosella]